MLIIWINLIVITPLDCQTHEARLNDCLHSYGRAASGNIEASKTLFSLYLAMQMPSAASNELAYAEAFKDKYNDVQAELGNGIVSAPKPDLYASAKHYQQRTFHVMQSQAQTCQQLNLQVQWQNAFYPQPLHYASEQILIDEDVLQNAPFHTQHRYQIPKHEYDEQIQTPTEDSSVDGINDMYSIIQQSQDFEL